METSPKPCCSKKRKAGDVENAGTKRLKSDSESGQSRENGHLPHSPRISVCPEHIQKDISEEELLELLHYSALNTTRGTVQRPSWCRLHRQKLVRAVCVVVVDQVSQSDFYQHYMSMHNLRNKYNMRVTLAASSTNLVSKIFSSQVTVIHKPPAPRPPRPQETQGAGLHPGLINHPVIKKFGTERRGLTAYLLSAKEMNDFPLTGRPGCEDFVRTDSASEVTDSSPLFGLDCEMCLTDGGSELTRVSLVDSTGACVLDQLVKPHNKIRNYLTQFSGVTPQMLKPVKTTLSEVQATVRSLLPSDAVLVGHSLGNDLRALKMIHPHVIDTSLLYRREFGQRFKLKVLAEKLLQKQIQTEDRRGHDPQEDAVAALELAQYFISHGPLEIVQMHLEELWGYSMTEEVETSQQSPTEHISERVTCSRFEAALQDTGRTVAFFGRRSDIGLHVSKQQWFNSDRQVLQSFRLQPRCPFFSMLQFCPGQTGTQVCPLRDLCVVFAGPFPPQFSEEDVRHLFCCCGPLHSVRMIHTALRVHAEVHFLFPESALLALSALNGLSLHGHCIKVQRPVNESTLDMEVTVGALQTDPLTHWSLFVVSLCTDMAQLLQANTHPARPSAETTPGASDSGPVQMNGLRRHRPSRLREEALLDTFSRFGTVVQIIPTTHTRRHVTHAYVEFERVASREAALTSSPDLLQLNLLLCPALTPPHLSPWRTVNTPAKTTSDHNPERTNGDLTSPAMARKLRKLDRRLGKLFRCLPDFTLSVVVLRGSHDSPGLCFLEVKQTSWQEVDILS